jgi:peptidoglycan/LPS O-acetylase OafA/YrhL
VPSPAYRVHPAETPQPRRFVAIDVLRAAAIAWVVLFHLWGDIEFFPLAPSVYYEQLGDQVRDGNGAWAVFTAFTDLVFRDGFQGVPLFMIISGISLTVAAYRSGDALRWHRFLYQRLRKLLVPYWAGVGLTYGVIALIAWRQSSLGQGDFGDRFTGGVTISRATVLSIDWGVAFASITLVPRLVEQQWFFAPQLALWFVGLLAQYYLLFPLLFVAMRRMGVPLFLVATFALTVASNWWIVDRYGAPEFKFTMVTGWAPFRMFEFAAGMAVGWLLVAPEGRRWLSIVRHPAVCALALAGGFAAHTAGDLMIGEWTLRYWQSLALPLVTLGLALLVVPVIVRWPERVDSWRAVQAVATVGVMSYAVLIVNDALRLVASQVRVEEPSQQVWWLFLAAYVPVSIALAWPLARVLGLLPQQPARQRRVARAPARAAPIPDGEVVPAPSVAG